MAKPRAEAGVAERAPPPQPAPPTDAVQAVGVQAGGEDGRRPAPPVLDGLETYRAGLASDRRWDRPGEEFLAAAMGRTESPSSRRRRRRLHGIAEHRASERWRERRWRGLSFEIGRAHV